MTGSEVVEQSLGGGGLPRPNPRTDAAGSDTRWQEARKAWRLLVKTKGTWWHERTSKGPGGGRQREFQESQ